MRNGIQDFALANAIYKGATVTFYTVSGGVKTATKATLYADPSSATTLANPQHLGADGKFVQPVYVEVAVIATITGLTIPDHDTSIIQEVLGTGSSIDLPAVIHAATNKTAAVGADEVGIWDSVTGLLNRLSLTNLFNSINTILSAKTTPVDADSVVMIDSAASNASKKLTFANLWVWIQAKLAGATSKATPVNADTIPLTDSAAANATKTLTWANLKTTLGSTFAALAGSATQVFAVAAATGSTHAVRLDQVKIAQDFRLTLTSGTPVTTADVTGATSIFATPMTGNLIGLYNGSVWTNYTSAEFSLALGTLTSGKPYDVFAYANAGVPTLEFLVWTNDTARATALAYQNGILVKNGDATRRYLGSFYTTAATTTEDSKANRYLYNYYNRTERELRRRETTASWTYQTATSRLANNSASNIVSVLVGIDEDVVHISATGVCLNANAIVVFSGIGVDSTTTASYGASADCVNGIATVARAVYEDRPGIGRHYFSWLESSQASGTTTWYGPAQTAQGMVIQPGLHGSFSC